MAVADGAIIKQNHTTYAMDDLNRSIQSQMFQRSPRCDVSEKATHTKPLVIGDSMTASIKISFEHDNFFPTTEVNVLSQIDVTLLFHPLSHKASELFCITNIILRSGNKGVAICSLIIQLVSIYHPLRIAEPGYVVGAQGLTPEDIGGFAPVKPEA